MQMLVPVRGLRVHRTPEHGAVREGHERAVWLLQLREVAVQRLHRHEALTCCLSAVRSALENLPVQVAETLEKVTSAAVEIGLTVAREMIGEALDRGLVDPTPIVRRCLDDAVVGLTDARIMVHLHPEDLSLVISQLDKDPATNADAAQCDFTPDPTLARGAVRVDTAAGRLVYDQREVLERIAGEMRRVGAEAAVVGSDSPGEVVGLV